MASWGVLMSVAPFGVESTPPLLAGGRIGCSLLRLSWHQQTQAEISQHLPERGRKLSDAREQRNKVTLRHQLVDLRADRDAVVLTVAKVSPGSVLQSGDELITLVPNDASLEVEANIVGRDAGFVQAGNPAVIKFDAFPYTTYGHANGTVKAVSADSFANPRSARERPGRPGASQDAAKDGPFYRATISLDEVRLHNLPRAPHVTQGMPVTVDIKVGQHTILAYLISRAISVFSEDFVSRGRVSRPPGGEPGLPRQRCTSPIGL